MNEEKKEFEEYWKKISKSDHIEDWAKILSDQPSWLVGCTQTFSFQINNIRIKNKKNHSLNGKSIKIQLSDSPFGED